MQKVDQGKINKFKSFITWARDKDKVHGQGLHAEQGPTVSMEGSSHLVSLTSGWKSVP